MSQNNDTPIYNLKAVVQETGLKPDTLRAWERRYGVPEPNRAPSGHRLYTQRDIDTLKWLLARLDEGLNISRAVALWQEVQKEAGDPLQVAATAAAAKPPHLPMPPASQETGSRSDALTMLQDQWLAACLHFDEQMADQSLSSAFALFPVETVCIEMLQRGLARIGEGWYQGKVTVQQEHFASALAMRRLESLLASTPPPTRAERILVGCPSEEAHTFVPLMLSLLLRRRGWNVIYLGADVPVRSLELTVKTTRPALVILTAQQLSTAASLLELSQVLLAERVPLAYGGLVFTHVEGLTDVIPGHYLGSHLDQAVRQAEQLMHDARPVPPRRVALREYIDALHHFQERKALIEAEVWRTMANTGMPQRHLAAANANLGRNILAALALGDMGFLDPDMNWIEGLLVNHYQMPVHLLDDYLAAYFAAVRNHLDEAGAPIVYWFSRLLGHSPESMRLEAVLELSARRGRGSR